MGWIGGEWFEGRYCEDAPCCGCCSPALDAADDRYWAERDPSEDESFYDEDEDYCEDCEASLDECSCESSEYWGAEDSALESSLFGDC
jgi:hypothetical protein